MVKDIQNIVWRACDTFRGTIDPSDYKNYILTMLFVKYLSDVWQDRKSTYEEQYGGNAERVRRALERERFVVPTVELKDKPGKNVIDMFPATFDSLLSAATRTTWAMHQRSPCRHRRREQGQARQGVP